MKMHISILRWVTVLAVSGCCLPEAHSQEWSQFRGNTGMGEASHAANLPVEWSETQNVAWKTEIPSIGWSTPVAMDGKLWLSGATKEGHEFYAYAVDAKSGKIVFEEKLFHCDKPEPLGNSVNCYASPSAVIEKGRVYFNFGSYGTACLETPSGKILWKRDDMPCRHYRGPGSSAILHENLLILTFDGVDRQYVTALDKLTGKTIWRTDRTTEWTDWDVNGKPKRDGDFRKAFATPVVMDHEGTPILICPASSSVFAYDANTGKELWKVPNTGHSTSVSPIYGAGLVIAATGAGKSEILAIRPDGSGDVSESHVEWRFGGRDVPTTPSPVIVDDLIYLISNRGTLTCLELETGESVWREKIGGNYIASPVHSNGRIYFLSSSGKIVVIRAGRTFEQMAENRLDEGFMASPCVLNDALILRTKTHLYRIEN